VKFLFGIPTEKSKRELKLAKVPLVKFYKILYGRCSYASALLRYKGGHLKNVILRLTEDGKTFVPVWPQNPFNLEKTKWKGVK